MNKLKILLVDDHEIVRAGFKSLLENADDYEIIEASSAEEAYLKFSDESPDIIVMDINMPGMGGLEAIRRIRRRDPETKILVLSMYDDASYLSHTNAEGVMGYVTKRSAPVELVKAIRDIARGRKYFSIDVRDKQQAPMELPTEISTLSRREFEVMTLLANGISVANIAESLNISPKTVSNHRDSILNKLDINNLVNLTRYAIRHGVIEA